MRTDFFQFIGKNMELNSKSSKKTDTCLQKRYIQQNSLLLLSCTKIDYFNVFLNDIEQVYAKDLEQVPVQDLLLQSLLGVMAPQWLGR